MSLELPPFRLPFPGSSSDEERPDRAQSSASTTVQVVVRREEPLPAHVRRGLASAAERMDFGSVLRRYAASEIGRVYVHNEREIKEALSAVQALRHELGPTDEAELAAFRARRDRFLTEMAELGEAGIERIRALASHAALPDRSFWDELSDRWHHR